jgi:hypothetical protein
MAFFPIFWVSWPHTRAVRVEPSFPYKPAVHAFLQNLETAAGGCGASKILNLSPGDPAPMPDTWVSAGSADGSIAEVSQRVLRGGRQRLVCRL